MNLNSNEQPKRFTLNIQRLQHIQPFLMQILNRTKALQGQAEAAHAQALGLAPAAGPPPPGPSDPPNGMSQPGASNILRPPTTEPARGPTMPQGSQQVQPPHPNQLQLQQQQAPMQHPVAGSIAQKGPSISKMRKNAVPGPSASSPSPAASTPVNHAPTPAPAESPNTPKSPANASKPAPGKGGKTGGKNKVQPPPKRPRAKSTPKIPPAEVPSPAKQDTERPSSKRGPEDEGQREGANGAVSSPKRPRTDPQEELDRKRAEDVAAASVSMEAAFSFLDKSAQELAAVSASSEQPAPQPTLQSLLAMLNENASSSVPDAFGTMDTQTTANELTASTQQEEEPIDDWLWAIDSSRFGPDETVVGETPELVQSTSSQGPTPNSDGGVDAPAVKKEESTDVGVTEGFEWWNSVGIRDGRYYSDDSDWMWEGDIKTNGEWPITYPGIPATHAA